LKETVTMSTRDKRVVAELKNMEDARRRMWGHVGKAALAGSKMGGFDVALIHRFVSHVTDLVADYLFFSGEDVTREQVAEFVTNLALVYRGFRRCNGPEVKELIEGGAPPGVYSFIEEHLIRQVKADELSRRPPESNEN
jgi:hypothetical protein